MPCQSQQDRSVAAVIVVIKLLQPLCDRIIYLLVILKLGREWTLCLRRLAKPFWLLCIQAVTTSYGNESTGAPEETCGVALILVWAVFGGVSTALILLAKSLLGRDEAGGACGGGAESRGSGAQGASEAS